MTPAEIKALAAPISDEEPCGPDLEMLGDADYMRFVARIDGVLPKSFASFDRGSIDFPAEFATLKALLGRSRDLRLIVFLAKLNILNRDLAAFVASTQAIEGLLDGQWERVQPELIDGDAILRIVSLQTLDDMPDAVMPLQSAPLFESRRFGKASFRSHLLAQGVIQARVATDDSGKDEETPSQDALRNALAETDLAELVAMRDLASQLRQALARIEELVNEKSGQPGALKFDKLLPLAQDITAFLDGAVAARDPSLALAPVKTAESDAPSDDDGGGPAVTGSVRTLEDATAALAAAAGYFSRAEPSSPALLLIGQAEALIGRPFFEAMQVLTPDYSSQSSFRIGRDIVLDLSLERLSALSITTAEPDAETAEENGDVAEDDNSGWEETPAEEESPQGETDETADAEGGGEADENPEDAPADEDTSEPAAIEQPADDEQQRDEPKAVGAPAHTPTVFRAVNRQQAVALLNQVAAYFRAVEPSSPTPLLLEHAVSLVGRDFFGILRDVLPAAALRVDE
ncbi:MAG: hypothetical protein BGP06_01435 [Rhizobiales bacterium 65-9]|nr:type VI secretion system ImpA family N-terminal domain-containing protein [Hyphomicrobiales bacterium]OJY37626.1 MAG: hypothetical protein BGP06_01435 [Rhizobiales bacterium 65-9]